MESTDTIKVIYEKNKKFVQSVLYIHTNHKYTFEDLESQFQRIYTNSGYYNDAQVFRVHGTRNEIVSTDSGEKRKKPKKVQLFQMRIDDTRDYKRVMNDFVEFCERFEQIRLINKIYESQSKLKRIDQIVDDLLRNASRKMAEKQNKGSSAV